MSQQQCHFYHVLFVTKMHVKSSDCRFFNISSINCCWFEMKIKLITNERWLNTISLKTIIISIQKKGEASSLVLSCITIAQFFYNFLNVSVILVAALDDC